MWIYEPSVRDSSFSEYSAKDQLMIVIPMCTEYKNSTIDKKYNKNIFGSAN